MAPANSSARARSLSNSSASTLATTRVKAKSSTAIKPSKIAAPASASNDRSPDLEAPEASSDISASFRGMHDEATLLVERRQFSSDSFGNNRPRPVAYLAFVILGCSAWIVTNVTYVELSALMLRLPESFSIFSYAIFALQSANVYPILLMLLDREHRVLKLNHAVWSLLAIGFAVSVFLTIFWDSTATIFGQTHSVAFLLLTHFGGLVSATSNIVMYPYVSSFPPLYTSAYSTGGGMSGSIAALLGLVQKPYSSHLNFSVAAFYVICVVVYMASGMAFVFLECHPIAKSLHQQVPPANDQCASELENADEKVISPHHQRTSHGYSMSTPHGREPHRNASLPAVMEMEVESRGIQKEQYHRRWHKMLRLFWKELVCFFALSSFAYAIIPSIMSFVYRRYAPGNDASMASKYQTYASIGALVLDPLARFVTSFYRVYCVYKSSALLLALGMMLLILSMISDPLFSGTSAGYLFPLLSHVGFLTVFAYTQTMLFLQLKRETVDADDADLVQIAYQWSGLLTQIGALTGTVFIFPLTVCAPQLFQ